MKAGIAPPTLVAQVRSTASWLWTDPRAAEVTSALDREARTDVSSLALMLAAHFATVATFVPTDVDARIRHHVWAAMEDAGALAEGCAAVDAAARWDPRWVSARVVVDPAGGRLSGHDGEWLGVRAGALGRALTLGDDALATQLAAAIDAELEREEAILDAARQRGIARAVLETATTIAHNLGDLSRVVEAWPASVRERGARFVRLGHPDAPLPRPAFVFAGALNKAMLALENHRFLALRKARSLRASRDLLLPIGPWFDAWGETIATHPALEAQGGRAEVVTALLEIHASSPDQLGCLRALAGIHRATRGGLELYAPELPARLRKEPFRGRVREALDVPPARFEARLQKRFETWISAESPFR